MGKYVGGADAIVLNMLRNIALSSDEKNEKICRTLMHKYPEMVLVQMICRKILSKIEKGEEYRNAVESIRRKILLSKEMIAKNFLRVVPEGATIITLSCSSTVLHALKKASGKVKLVVVAESRPLFEGRKTARELAKMFDVKLITDASIGYFTKKADLGIIGADTITKNGSVLNKMGSYLLALACKKEKKPLYVLSSILKLDQRERGVKIKKREPSEIWNKAPKNIECLNFYFEEIPPMLISGIICEFGIFTPKKLANESSRLQNEFLVFDQT